VSFTSDIWEDADRRAFMSVTAHFIVRRDNQLALETHLIALRHIIGRHTGAVLAPYLRTILQEAGVLHKVHTCCLSLVLVLTCDRLVISLLIMRATATQQYVC
jgi:hypothetical protein